VGPVSFESLDGGASRSDALRLARLLGDAGVRVASIVVDEQAGALRYRLVISSADSARARQVIGAAGS
jgi:hypothetical protein